MSVYRLQVENQRGQRGKDSQGGGKSWGGVGPPPSER